MRVWLRYGYSQHNEYRDEQIKNIDNFDLLILQSECSSGRNVFLLNRFLLPQAGKTNWN